MRILRRPRTLKDELQILFLAVGTAFLVLATILLYQNGQASLRRQLLASASSAAETASALVSLEDHRSVRTPEDFNSRPFRNIVQSLGALRRANPEIVHLFTIAPIGELGAWGIVVDMGGSAPDREYRNLVRGRLPIGSPPPPSLPPALIREGMTGTAAGIFDLSSPSRARAVAVAPIMATRGGAVGLVVVELSAAGLIAEVRLLFYVSIAIFLVGLVVSVVASNMASRWVTRPIEELLLAVDEIAKGNLRARVTTTSRNELGALGNAFNLMAKGLEASKANNDEQQNILRELHRTGSQVAATLELPRMLETAARGLRSICGGEEAFAGAMGPRDKSVRLWTRSGPGTLDLEGWDTPVSLIEEVLGGETRLLARKEFASVGLPMLLDRPGDYALASPLRVSDQTLGILVALGGRTQFHPEGVSLAALFARQVSAAVGNARVFEQVRAVDRSKSEFLSIASHEVRTPLTVMKSSLDILVSSPKFEYTADQRQLIAFCQESVERLIRLVKDILDVSKIEAGVLSIQFQPTSLNDLIEKCLFWVPQLPGGQGIEVDARLPSQPAMVLADGQRIMQVLENLISNAIKFSNPGGKVTIELREHDREYEVVVSDQGKGIAPEDLGRIFGKFFQVADSATREQGGTGLGLAICKGIVEAHHGKIWAESALGDGSRFHFSLARVLDTPIGDRAEGEISVDNLLSSLRTASARATRIA
jgi:two-component system sensor histidine kinase VicK